MNDPAHDALRSMHVDPEACTAEALRAAADWLRAGGIVAFPTDTYYGLAVDPESHDAVRLLFEVKGRDAGMAIPLVAATESQVREAIGLPDGPSTHLAARFWPGPLSLVLDAPPSIAPAVTGGRATVAVRVPAHRVARALPAAFGRPVTATSANLSGMPPADRAAAIGAIANHPRVLVIDGGVTPGGAPSTIVDARGAAPVCVRAGAIAWDRVLTSR